MSSHLYLAARNYSSRCHTEAEFATLINKGFGSAPGPRFREQRSSMTTNFGFLVRLVRNGTLFVVVLLVGGVVFDLLATAREQRTFPPVGQLVDGGGYRLHLHCVGSGSPTVVLESGFGMTLHAWALVQPQVARLTRACAYDRPGYGWSDLPRQPRTGGMAADDLHRALQNAGIQAPYVLVGHSMGGGQARLFASRYPHEVAGLVLVATGHEDWRTRNLAAGPEDEATDRVVYLAAALARVRLSRLVGVLLRPALAAEYAAELRRYLPPNAVDYELTALAQAKQARAMAAELRATRETEAQLRTARDFGNTPLVVLSERWFFSEKPDAKELEAARVEDELQTEMTRFSRQGQHVRVDAGHLIPLQKPEVIVEAVGSIVSAARHSGRSSSTTI
jgi:pimeloyl-ACP methyl ester carboxylesterase